MKIIPAINCKDFKCVKERFLIAQSFLPKNGWIQIDVGDGKFTKAKTWNNPTQLKNLQPTTYNQRFNIEIHLMAENPEKHIKKWLEARADRVIFHLEAIKNNLQPTVYDLQQKKIGIAIKPETDIECILPLLNKIKFVQLLAVKPGFSGQRFDKRILRKIKIIKKKYPKVTVEIDGGINEKIAQTVKKAGADIAVAGSYIFESKNPKESYKILKELE
ncbi:MAG: ribulose-phosphate 3-epimerase [Patescibacteria group bacterium]|nr:ribulose-phosphate 3-epimerase [Patescibacteria group bacterium]